MLKNKKLEKNKKKIWFLSISDIGRGISSKIIPNLFQKFITDSDFGTGLGLYITRKLVEAMELKYGLLTMRIKKDSLLCLVYLLNKLNQIITTTTKNQQLLYTDFMIDG